MARMVKARVASRARAKKEREQGPRSRKKEKARVMKFAGLVANLDIKQRIAGVSDKWRHCQLTQSLASSSQHTTSPSTTTTLSIPNARRFNRRVRSPKRRFHVHDGTRKSRHTREDLLYTYSIIFHHLMFVKYIVLGATLLMATL